MRRLLFGILALGLAVRPAWAAKPAAADRTGDPIGEISFTSDPGPMGPRYLRVLRLQVGDRPSREDLDEAAERLSELSNLGKVDLQKDGSLLKLTLADQPVTSFMVTPFPVLWQIGLGAAVENWHVAGTYLSTHLWGSYNWDTLWVYDPRAATPAATSYFNRYTNLYADAGVLVAPDVSVYLVGEGDVSAIADDLSKTYDPAAQTQGFSASLGPELRYSNVDSDGFPRFGTRSRLGARFGSPSIGAPGDFAIYHGEIERYMPVGDRETMVTALHVGLTRGEVPWNEKLRAGGADNLRGTLYERFMGDQLLAGSFEYRRRLTDDLVPSLYKGVGLYSGLFLDVGRVWDSRVGTPFPQDMRPGVGGYMGVSVGNWNIGRLEVSYGTEGPSAGLVMGLPFDW